MGGCSSGSERIGSEYAECMKESFERYQHRQQGWYRVVKD